MALAPRSAFFKNPENKKIADSCAIFVGTSHCEPMLRNNVDEWNGAIRGKYNYRTNKQQVHDYWIERLKGVSNSATNMYTIGMRGIHDGSMEGCSTAQDIFDALQQVIDDQQMLLDKYTDAALKSGKPISGATQARDTGA